MSSRRPRLSDEGARAGQRAGGRWGQKRETKRDEAPEASCYATADLLTYISKQKQLAAGYWSASPTQHREPGQKHTGCGTPAYWTRLVVCVHHFAFYSSHRGWYKETNNSHRATEIFWIQTQKPQTVRMFNCLLFGGCMLTHTNTACSQLHWWCSCSWRDLADILRGY